MSDLQVGENLTVHRIGDSQDEVLLIDDQGRQFELRTSPGYAEAFESMYGELLSVYGMLEHRQGLKDRVDLITRDERNSLKKCIELAQFYR